jgi:signal peptide peptidase SppA
MNIWRKSMNKSRVLQAFVEMPWAILPHKLEALKEIVERHANGDKLDAAEIESRIHGASRPADRRVNSVAVLPLFGTIFPRANLMTDMSGATSAERFGAQFAALLRDPEVGAIVLDVNSPGGAASGIEEVSKQIFDARGQKPIVAVVNHLMASAAYWIGSSADEIVITPSGDAGSIGVFAVHEDWSVALDKAGIKVSIIKEGKYKAEGNPYEPLSEEARAAIQTRVGEVYDAFVEAVARNRGVKVAVVRNGFGEGRVVGARESVKLGMADRIGTLEETVNDLLGRNVSSARFSAVASDESKLAEGGQVPASVNVHTQEARARLAQVENKTFEGEPTMYQRELLNKREALLARANELVDAADKESRDMTDEERAEFNEIMGVGDNPGQLAELDVQIERIQGEREKLRAAAEKKFTSAGKDAEKPSDTNAGDKAMKLEEYNKLSPEQRLAFVKAGGKLID